MSIVVSVCLYVSDLVLLMCIRCAVDYRPRTAASAGDADAKTNDKMKDVHLDTPSSLDGTVVDTLVDDYQDLVDEDKEDDEGEDDGNPFRARKISSVTMRTNPFV